MEWKGFSRIIFKERVDNVFLINLPNIANYHSKIHNIHSILSLGQTEFYSIGKTTIKSF